eukprot:71296-Pleurochrysis_carterae.AAC.1
MRAVFSDRLFLSKRCVAMARNEDLKKRQHFETVASTSRESKKRPVQGGRRARSAMGYVPVLCEQLGRFAIGGSIFTPERARSQAESPLRLLRTQKTGTSRILFGVCSAVPTYRSTSRTTALVLTKRMDEARV